MDGKVKAPFNKQQVDSLNEIQKMILDCYLCASPKRFDRVHSDKQEELGGDFGQLIAEEKGLVCPACGYVQDWADEWRTRCTVPAPVDTLSLYE